MVSPGEGDRELVKDGSVDLNRPETARPNRVYRGGNIGVEISCKSLDKFGIYRIGIQSLIFTANPRSGSTGIHVMPPAFEIACPS